MTKPVKKVEQRGRLAAYYAWLDKKMAGIRKWSDRKKKQSKFWRVALPVLWGLGLAVWVGGALLLSQFLVVYILINILPRDMLVSNSMTALYSVIMYAVCLVITIFVPWFLLKKKTTRNELGLYGAPTWTDVLLSPVGYIVMMIAAQAVMLVATALLPGVNWEQTQETGFNNLYRFEDFTVAFFSLVILAPICEEIIFRGWLYGKLRSRMAAVPAIIIVSVLFGLMHGQWNVGLIVGIMSVIMCIQRELTGTIWSGILLHMIKNGVAFYLLFVR